MSDVVRAPRERSPEVEPPHDRGEQEPVPAPVAAMLARYRAELAEHGYDWGNEVLGGVKTLLRFADRCDPDRWGAEFVVWKASGTIDDPVAAVLRALAHPVPPGVAVARADAIEVADPLPFALASRPFRYEVLVPGDNGEAGSLLEAVVSAERPDLHIGGRSVRAVERVPSARVRLVANAVTHWSVVDERGGAWFPDGAHPKYDAKSKPYFYGDDVSLDVPAVGLTLTAARGCEFRTAAVVLDLGPGEEKIVVLEPERIYDAALRGWYGADLHVHMNYTGDLVWSPEEAVLAQRGEGLHLMNLVAANYSTELVYDRELLECFAGRDLPGGDAETVTRIGVEYRNDMLGHFHALGATAAPSRYYTGHTRSDEPHDWPPNADAAAELRRLGATIGYTHVLALPFGEDGSPAEALSPRRARSYEARELVADAALGLVDSVDLIVGDIAGAERLYHRLLGCGLRLAATAGTDIMLSRARGRLTSNPPGWCRVYANLHGSPLSVSAWQDAVRAGRTFATNGPWLELEVGGFGPGDVLSTSERERIQLVARMVGAGVERVEVVGPDGPVATLAVSPGAGHAELVAEFEVDEPVWLAAVARGLEHPLAAAGRPNVYAHTSPVWIDVAGQAVARAADAAWCLDWLGHLERLACEAGSFADAGQLEDLLRVIERARSFYGPIAAGAAVSR